MENTTIKYGYPLTFLFLVLYSTILKDIHGFFLGASYNPRSQPLAGM